MALNDGGASARTHGAQHTLADTLEKLVASRTREDIVAVLRGGARDCIGADAIAVIVRENDACRYAAADGEAAAFVGRRFPLEECLAGEAMMHERAISVSDVSGQARLQPYAGSFVRGLVVAPIGSPAGAALAAYWSRPGPPPSIAAEAVDTLARAASMALANVRLIASLEQSERRLRDVLDSVSDAYYAVDRQWRLITFNAAAERYFGFARDDVLGRGIWELFPQGEDAPFGALCRGAMDEGRSSRLETASALRPGRAVELNITPTYEGFCVTLSDVTERREVERELRASEARFREHAEELAAVLDAAPSAIWIARDSAGDVIDGNRFARDLLRVAGDANLSKSAAGAETALQHFRVLDAAGAEIAPHMLPVQRAARGELVLDFEERLAFADGSEAWLIGNAAPLRDGAGRPRGAVAAFADITALKKVEHDLREREQMFRTLAETISDVFYVADRAEARRLLYVSPAFARVWGRPVEWLIEDSSRFHQTIHPADREAVRTGHESWTREAPLELTYRIVRPDGEARWILDRAFPVVGELTRIVGLSEDITERKNEERRRDLLLHELNHRVKNSLAVVQAMAMQSLQAPDRARAAATFDARLQALARAHDVLIQDEWEGGELAAVVRRAVGMQADRPERVTLDGPPLPLNARTALALTLALHELGANAVKYGALSSPDGRVDVAWSVRDGRLQLSWREIGGPPVAIPERKGFGLRLIERGLAHELQGQVAVEFLPDGVVCSIDAPLPDTSSDLIGHPRGLDPKADGAGA